jgi:hypothetical protein
MSLHIALHSFFLPEKIALDMSAAPRTILRKYFAIKSIEKAHKAIKLSLLTRAFLTRVKKYH